MSTRRILKFPVKGCGADTLITCRRYAILDIQLQGTEMVCWIETDDSLPETTVELTSIGTGWNLPSELMDNYYYIKTVQDADEFVWHFYERLEFKDFKPNGEEAL